MDFKTQEILSGEFNIPLVDLNLGQNILYVEIWDNFNNKTVQSIILNIENFSFKAYDVYNFPNPFSERTYFTFKTSSFPCDVVITIFDLNGRKINEVNDLCVSSFCSLEWNGRNSSSKYVKNGTYIYHLKLTNQSSGNIFEGVYKLTKLK